MNRIILIGNGFDLAHGLETSYKHFIDDYWQNVITTLNNSVGYPFNDKNININPVPHGIKDSKSFEDLKKIIKESFITNHSKRKIPIEFTINNKFLEIISTESRLKNWVDIEYEYYRILKDIAQEKSEDYKDISELNDNFEKIKNLLFSYISKESRKSLQANHHYFDILFHDFYEKDFIKNNDKTSKFPNQILFLNFNYTDTNDIYINSHWNKWKAQTEYIKIHTISHKVNYPIFGYGDELDDDYKAIEKLNDNRYLDNIKSIQYLQTDNYKKLISFIESEPYQVFIMGHSCGLSDRTLLNTLFEHNNCVSIKPFFYEYEEDGVKKDNYIELVQNISRNFNDKVKMRDRVVNKTYCEALPQFK